MIRAALILLASPALAQPLETPCLPYAKMTEALKQGWNEAPVLRGLDVAGNMIVVFVGSHGTFTILAVAPDMTACPISVGGAVEAIQPKGNL